MNSPLQCIPLVLPLMILGLVLSLIAIGCRISDLKLDVKEITTHSNTVHSNSPIPYVLKALP